MIETFLTSHDLIVGAGVSEYLDMLEPMDTLPACRAAWAAASPRDKQGCLEFIKANSQGRGKRLGLRAAWAFVRCTNLDTGRKFLAAALLLQHRGLTCNQMRTLVGLPKVSGGDNKQPGLALKPLKGVKQSEVLNRPLARKPENHDTRLVQQPLMSRDEAKRRGLYTKPAKRPLRRGR